MMKPIHLSAAALIAAIAGIATAIATQNSGALAASILALVTAFLPAIPLVLPWFQPPPPPPTA